MLLVTALLAAGAGVPAAAPAATPERFFGVLADGPMLDGSVDVAAELRLMRASGVGSVRLPVYWRELEPEAGAFAIQRLDAFIGAAADAGLDVLPVVMGTPAWAARAPVTMASPPADPATYARFMGRLVRRYGPGGAFWAARAGRVVPVHSWQIWNEPDLPKFWATKGSWERGYVRLLRAARRSVKSADPASKVVLAGLTNRSWLELRSLYRAGARGQFDVAAGHPFSATVANVVRIVGLLRAEMRRAGDARTPLMLTEVSWTSGKGRSTLNYGWETTESGQAAKVREALKALAARRGPDRLAGLYWATWLSPQIGSKVSFDYSGLRRMDAGRPVAKPALTAFRTTVARLTR